MFQVSTATALVEGIYQGAVRVATLRKHGDLGLGTFEGLDGEIVIVDGHFFQVRSGKKALHFQEKSRPYLIVQTASEAVELNSCVHFYFETH